MTEENKLKKFQKLIDYEFRDETLLRKALTTLKRGDDTGEPDYDILETLGDAIIKLILILKLIREEDINSGIITQKKQCLENNKVLSTIASKYLELENFIFRAKSQDIEKDICGTKIVADVFEAVCGAMYLDSDLNINLIEEKLINQYYNEWVSITKDSIIFQKNNLLEYLQKIYRITPQIDIEYEKIGPDHNPTWFAKNPKILDQFKNVLIPLKKDIKSGEYNSKKEAEQDLYLKILNYFKNSDQDYFP